MMIALISLIGLSGCAALVSTEAICARTANSAENLRVGLIQNPQTPDAVGRPAVDILITLKAGCAQ